MPASGIRPAACSTARSATTCVASRRVAAAYGVAHLALRTPFYVQNPDARSASTVVTNTAVVGCVVGRYAAHHGRVTTVDALRAWEHWSTGVVLFRSRDLSIQCVALIGNQDRAGPPGLSLVTTKTIPTYRTRGPRRKAAPTPPPGRWPACTSRGVARYCILQRHMEYP